MALFLSILGEDSSSSKEIDADEVSASASGSEEVTSGRLGQSTKTPHFEESKAESDECLLSTRHLNPAPAGTPPRAVGDAMAGGAQGALYLSECLFLFFCVSLMVACLQSTGDLTKAIVDPAKGVVPDLARVGLDASLSWHCLLGRVVLRCPLVLAVKVYFDFLAFISLCFCLFLVS